MADIDYHHGNGTQALVGGGLSYLSTHAMPAYPGTGSPLDNHFAPAGTLVNVPIAASGISTEAFVAIWTSALRDLTARLRPGILIVSAGYDFVAGDPVGDLGVSMTAAQQLGRLVREVAETYCSGRALFVLEGGYDPVPFSHAASPTRSKATTSAVRRSGRAGSDPGRAARGPGRGGAAVIDRIVLLLRVALGLVFLAAGALKVGHADVFASEIAGFQLLPHPLIAPLALLLPFLELMIGAYLVVGLFTRFAACLAAAFEMAVFAAAIASAVLRGISTSCGCFGPSDRSHDLVARSRAAILGSRSSP